MKQFFFEISELLPSLQDEEEADSKDMISSEEFDSVRSKCQRDAAKIEKRFEILNGKKKQADSDLFNKENPDQVKKNYQEILQQDPHNVKGKFHDKFG